MGETYKVTLNSVFEEVLAKKRKNVRVWHPTRIEWDTTKPLIFPSREISEKLEAELQDLTVEDMTQTEQVEDSKSEGDNSVRQPAQRKKPRKAKDLSKKCSPMQRRGSTRHTRKYSAEMKKRTVIYGRPRLWTSGSCQGHPSEE